MSEFRKAEEAIQQEGLMLPHKPAFKKGRNWHQYNGVRYEVDTFYKELAWEEIIVDGRNGRILHRTWFFNQSDYPCINKACRYSHDAIVFNIQRTGVVMLCRNCSIGTLAVPFDVESGEEIAELVLTEEVSVQDALKITERTGQPSEFLSYFLGKPKPRKRVHLSDEKPTETGGE